MSFHKYFIGAAQIGAAVAVIGAGAAHAEEAGGFFSFTDENDLWSDPLGTHQDRHYTHGTKLTWLASGDDLPRLTRALGKIPTRGMNGASGNAGFTFGQSMFTPENILNPAPILNDRPYAGWLYAGLLFERRATHSDHLATMESFELDLGIVGHGSLADEAQKFIHSVRFPEDVPQGWNNQLKDEPGVLLKYARLWRWSPSARLGNYFDVIPRVGVEVGNVAIFGSAGATARLGWNLPDDFGVQIIDSPAAVNGGLSSRNNSFSAYLFAGADGRLVGHDITLAGNSYQTSQSVQKYDCVNDLSWGFAIQPCRHLEFSYVQVTRSKEFVGQRQKDVFGSFDVKFMCSF
jgi:hypothetical protein